MRLPLIGSGNKRLGLALGGGAVLGFAHLGVLKVLTEAGFKPAVVAGTSAGSLFGALFCCGLSCEEICAAAGKISWLDLITPTVPIMGLLKADNLEKVIRGLTGGKNIEDLPIPFCAVATDLATGKQVILRHGSVARAVRISCGIPGIFVPVEEDGKLLADGGLVNNVPVDVAHDMGADYIIAVDVSSSNIDKKPAHIGEVILRSITILISGTNPERLRQADIVVRPSLAGFSPQDMSKKEEIIAVGEAAMREIITKLPQRFLSH